MKYLDFCNVIDWFYKWARVQLLDPIDDDKYRVVIWSPRDIAPNGIRITEIESKNLELVPAEEIKKIQEAEAKKIKIEQ